MTKIGVLVGSLRKDSLSKKLVENVVPLFPDTHNVELIEIGHLPFYNQDDDTEDNVLESYQLFRNKIEEKDAFLFVTPEYNRSVPAVLKNAIDIASRPVVENKWNGKPAAIISQSPGRLGGFGANHHLRQTLTCLNMPVVQQPEMYVSDLASLLGDNGKITDERRIQSFQTFVDTFIQLIENNN